MSSRAQTISPRSEARIAGAIYVLVIALGAYAELVGRQRFVVTGSPIATLHTIAFHQSQYRLGFLAEMLTNVLAIPVTVIFVWRLLRPAGPTIALMALVFDLTQNTVNALNAWTQFAPLGFLAGSPDALVLTTPERAAFARMALHWHDTGFQIGLTFFGFALLLEGALVFRSGYFPRLLGLLYAAAGACYLVAACNYFLALHISIVRDLQLVSFAGEAAMALWLLLIGLNPRKWPADAHADNAPLPFSAPAAASG